MFDKFCQFQNDYRHTTEECRHLKNEIERLIQNGYLKEYSRIPGKNIPKSSMTGKPEVTDPPRKGVIRMIAGVLVVETHKRARKAQVREAYKTSTREVMEVEPANDAPLIQFDQEELHRHRIQGNNALVITALLANYEIKRVFIDSGSSTDILFREAYDQMQLGGAPPRDMLAQVLGGGYPIRIQYYPRTTNA
ncbi:hypothetical protein Sango_1975100 [Sesamum angolense]|uniref:Reverse transcriptase domain-containing protein n=1 Tax=Sesamum angolense TaxID=2727404 RepID=A0AAE1WEL1_9LAMI|nr:hypothetical protein Sango_1975100 [Sesamum angolense]